MTRPGGQKKPINRHLPRSRCPLHHTLFTSSSRSSPSIYCSSSSSLRPIFIPTRKVDQPLPRTNFTHSLRRRHCITNGVSCFRSVPLPWPPLSQPPPKKEKKHHPPVLGTQVDASHHRTRWRSPAISRRRGPRPSRCLSRRSMRRA